MSDIRMDLVAICLKVFESIFSPNELPIVHYISTARMSFVSNISMLIIESSMT